MILLKEKIEYEQANELFRHYHRLQWISGTVFISASFAILGLTWEIKELHLLFLFFLISVFLYVIWAIIQKRYQDFVEVARDRMLELEKMMGLDLHLKIKKEIIKKQ